MRTRFKNGYGSALYGRNEGPAGSGLKAPLFRQTSHRTQQENYAYWPLEVLTGYIQSAQQQLLSRQVPHIVEQFALACDRHRKVHPEITGVHDFFMDLCRDLRREMAKDAELHFPYLLSIADCHHWNLKVPVPEFSSIGNITHLSKVNHNAIGKGLETIIEMSFTFNRFTTVDSQHNLLLSSLNAMEDDLQSLIHLKFDILFPKAVEMENTVARNAASKAG